MLHQELLWKSVGLGLAHLQTPDEHFLVGENDFAILAMPENLFPQDLRKGSGSENMVHHNDHKKDLGQAHVGSCKAPK
jgi:hypothetical protein